MNLTERFWSHVDIRGENECWEWMACQTAQKYGLFGIDGTNKLAHRVAYELTHGNIPQRMQILHSCDNPSCVNPNHLRCGTQSENIREAVSKHRFVNNRGVRHGMHKLTDEQVRTIRQRVSQGESHTQVARDFNVSRVTVTDIILERRWGWLK